MKTPVLESERVILRPLTVNDAKTAFNNWTSDNRVTKYMRYNSHTSLDDTIEWLKMVELKAVGLCKYCFFYAIFTKKKRKTLEE